MSVSKNQIFQIRGGDIILYFRGFIYMVMHRLKVEIFKNLMKRKEYWYFLFIQSYENKAKYIKVFVQGCYN